MVPCRCPPCVTREQDIEASTVLWEELDALVMDVALNLHHDTLRQVRTAAAAAAGVVPSAVTALGRMFRSRQALL